MNKYYIIYIFGTLDFNSTPTSTTYIMRLMIIFIQLFFTTILCGQRYLSPIFSEIKITSDIEYGSAVNYENTEESLLLDFYEPKNDIESRRPLIIYAHGGGFTNTTQTKELTHIKAYCDSMARRGYMKAAVRFFKKEMNTYKIDTSLIFVGGESADDK